MFVDIWILVFVLRASVEFLTQYLMAICFIAESVQLHQNLTNYAVKLGRRNVCFRIILCPN